MRLSIGGPTRDTVPASFAVDLAYLYEYTLKHGPWSSVMVGFITATYIHVGRDLFLEAALKQGATHILWLDTDMSVPRTTAVQLMAHDQPIVGCNYRVRSESGLFTAQSEDGTRIQTTPTSTGLEAVAGLGFGAVLMRTDIVQGLPRPLFRHGLNLQNGDVGEDIMFCRTLRAAGHTIYIDHDLSKEIGHVGQHTYRTLTPVEVAV
jgi:hypothetical protein